MSKNWAFDFDRDLAAGVPCRFTLPGKTMILSRLSCVVPSPYTTYVKDGLVKRGDIIMIQAAFAITGAYLLGCFNTGYYLVRMLTGQDIRSLASGGTGSRNVGRLLGVRGFVLTLVGDAGKGAASIWLGRYLDIEPWLLFGVLLAVTAGHIFPAQLAFRGGKGFATLAGGLLLLSPIVLLSGFLLSVAFLLVLRRTTESGLLALACSPVLLAIERSRNGQSWLSPEVGIYCLLVLLVLYAHRDNISKDFCNNTIVVNEE